MDESPTTTPRPAPRMTLDPEVQGRLLELQGRAVLNGLHKPTLSGLVAALVEIHARDESKVFAALKEGRG